MARYFVYDGKEYNDPSPELTVQQVQEQFGQFIAEVVGAKVTETKRGQDTVYTFEKRVGVKELPPEERKWTTHVLPNCRPTSRKPA